MFRNAIENNKSDSRWPAKTGGFALRFYLILAVTVAAVVAFIIIPGYLHHVEDGRMTMDIQSVATCRDVASVDYLQSGSDSLVFYYYDELTHQCLPEEKRAQIRGYGRSYVWQNENGETGAAGIPNLGSTLSGMNDGPQILTVAVTGSGISGMRWTGPAWSCYDYYYMTDRERSMLTKEILRQIDRDSVLRALSAAQNEYLTDYRRQLKKGRDPGTAVYYFDALKDAVTFDLTLSSAKKPGGLEAGSAGDLDGYGVSDADGETGALAAGNGDGSAQGAELFQGFSEEEAAAALKGAAKTSDGSVLQVWVTRAAQEESSAADGTGYSLQAAAVWVES